MITYVFPQCFVQVLADGDPYCSVVNTMSGFVKTSKLKGSEAAIVDYVSAISTGPKEPLQKVQWLIFRDVIPCYVTGTLEAHQCHCGHLTLLDLLFCSTSLFRPDINDLSVWKHNSRMYVNIILIIQDYQVFQVPVDY